MKKILLAGLAIGLITFSSGVSSANIIWDFSPVTSGVPISADNWSNMSNGQNFADFVQFNADTTVTGIDIYSGSSFGSVGFAVNVRLWSDFNGTPTTLLQDIATTIDEIDTDGATSGLTRKHADISPLLLAAGTGYWIGMSGTSEELAQISLETDSNATMAMFSGLSFVTHTYVGDMAFRLEGAGGSSNPVPEPATMLLFGAGIAGLAAVSRRKRI